MARKTIRKNQAENLLTEYLATGNHHEYQRKDGQYDSCRKNRRTPHRRNGRNDCPKRGKRHLGIQIFGNQRENQPRYAED